MATKATNDAKRNAMKEIIDNLLSRGWTRVSLSDLLEGKSLSAWANGKSMGTNSQRAMLASLPDYSKAFVAARIQKDLATHQANLKEDEAKLVVQKATLNAKAVNGVVTVVEKDENSVSTRTTNVATGDHKDEVKYLSGDLAGETYTSGWNVYASDERYITEAKKGIARAEKALAKYR